MKKTIYFNVLILIVLSLSLPLFSAEKAEKTAPKPPSDYQYYLKSGEKSPQWDEFIEPAFSSFDTGNLPTSFVFMKRAFDKGCRDGLLLYRYGLYFETQGRAKLASDLLVAAAEKIPRQYPDHPLATAVYEHAGRALFKADDYTRAEPFIVRALATNPNNFALLFMGGQILRIAKKYPEARALFERALGAEMPKGAQNELRAKIIKELAAACVESGDFDAAQRYLEEILAASPADPVALQYKAKLEKEMRSKKEKERIKQLVQ